MEKYFRSVPIKYNLCWSFCYLSLNPGNSQNDCAFNFTAALFSLKWTKGVKSFVVAVRVFFLFWRRWAGDITVNGTSLYNPAQMREITSSPGDCHATDKIKSDLLHLLWPICGPVALELFLNRLWCVCLIKSMMGNVKNKQKKKTSSFDTSPRCRWARIHLYSLWLSFDVLSSENTMPCPDTQSDKKNLYHITEQQGQRTVAYVFHVDLMDSVETKFYIW